MTPLTPDEVLQIVPSMPSVRRPPFRLPAMLTSWSCTSFSASPGATRASVAVIASSTPSTGTKLMTAKRKRSAGKSASRK